LDRPLSVTPSGGEPGHRRLRCAAARAKVPAQGRSLHAFWAGKEAVRLDGAPPWTPSATLHAEVRSPSAAAPGREARRDGEYERCGTANVFCVVEQKAGRHFTYATADRFICPRIDLRYTHHRP
jgi:hypothetical protein